LRTRHQIELALSTMGAVIELCARQGNGIEARARRPREPAVSPSVIP